MLSSLCLAAASLVSYTGAANVTFQSNVVKISIVEFLSQNFDTFVDKYNQSHEENLIATELLRTRDLVLDEGKIGYYFDFDYGYMVASDDYEIYLISNYDLTFEDDLFLTDGTMYFTGSAFYDESGFEYGVAGDTYALYADNTYSMATLKSTESSSKNDGYIGNSQIDNYISSNYSEYDIVSEKYIFSYDYISQLDTSVYIRNIDGRYYSEGNCVINSTYSMLHNMGKKNRNRNFYYSDFYVNYASDIINDVNYSLTNNGWIINYYYRTGAPNKGKKIIESISDLYLRLREKAISSYGYDEESGMNGSYAKNMIMDIESFYGYNTKFFKTNNFATVKSLIDSNIPSIVRSRGSISYGNHAMAVNGYIKLEKTSSWWIFTSTDTKRILAVDDGHQESCVNGDASKRRFYDPNIKGGARFICADKDTIDFSTC